ncbi:glycosyltransferase involved in cell wall biosynthesis [Dysgonomonas alginatilytica]|uniref:Glycosyltransferase involved in cell wall biosynthesis n=1 Tax=Dysgonomonas alginatilytica TaxID=1605892 RepID=A0A2V3PN73_9BACT|nr:glycosyltransferase family 4 protein [Dysgonomonas alginatilytica]PXV61968.1 glycosyltransferase involved in cell wall biosynthesis [Dysgonomonas alginatilytica]
MKIVYCLIDSSRSGGMERSICSKANYLADVMGYDVTIITTDRKGKSNFFDFSSRINFIDLGINYDELETLPVFKALCLKLKKRKLHSSRLTAILSEIQPDISISTYTHELSILSEIKDGSKKIAEIHFCKPYKSIEYSSDSIPVLKRIIAIAGEKRKHRYINKYDVFVVLTEEDRKRWSEVKNVKVIPNLLSFYPSVQSLCMDKRVISVGRLTRQKGYPLLIEAWQIVAKKHPEWQFAIFGEGEDKDMLNGMIRKAELMSISIHPPTSNIIQEYLNSSVYVMSSIYEGFGLVLTEAMACGLPCVSFDCPSGPSEIIKDGEDGFLVKTGNIEELAQKIILLIEDESLRAEMGRKAKVNVQRFFSECIMPKWISLFNEIISSGK